MFFAELFAKRPILVFEVSTPKHKNLEKVHKTKKKPPKSEDLSGFFLELLGGFEPPTSSLPRMRSTD